MAKSIHRVSVVVRGIEDLGAGVRQFCLSDEDGWELPPFTAGAHVDVHLPSGGVRQYSLCGDPKDPLRYRIAVQREETGRGGSRDMHEGIQVGQELLLSLPRNHFPMVSEGPVVMLAGGIGITPFLSVLPELVDGKRDYALHYCTRSADHSPFCDELKPYAEAGHVKFHRSDENTRLDLAALIEALEADTHLYCCGPERMIDACLAIGEHLGDRLHVEYFGAKQEADIAYEVELSRSGRVISVPEGQTMLQALRAADVEIAASCEAGICLDCKTRWLQGAPVHRELTMPKAERREWITPCVSGCEGGKIVLDL